MTALDDERYDGEGNLDPAGDWKLCGCGDAIPLAADQCENCRVADELFEMVIDSRACPERSSPDRARCVYDNGHPGPHFGVGLDPHGSPRPVWWNAV